MPLQRNLERHGLKTPTPVQAQSIPPALEGRDVVATAQTGTGKTLAFAIPVLEKLAGTNGNGPVRAVVLSPTRELAIQINDTFAKLTAGTPIRTAVVVGGVNEQKQLKVLRRGVQIVIATPGRLCDFLERRLVKLDQAQCFVLDEADRMLDMGFLPSIQEILAATPEQKQTLLFSATIEKSVAHLIDAYVKDPVRISIGATTRPAEFVDLHHYEVANSEKLSLLSHLLESDGEGSFLVFARTKHGTDRLTDQLGMAGFRAARIHGNRTQSQRNQALDGFKRGQYRILVATDVAARGIHVDGIAHVVNYDLPQVPEDFIHRVGRTGRAGARGVASTFSTRQERGEIRRIERAISLRLEQRSIPSLGSTPRTAPQQQSLPSASAPPLGKQRNFAANNIQRQPRATAKPFSSEEFRLQLLADEAALRSAPVEPARQAKPAGRGNFAAQADGPLPVKFADKHFKRKKAAHQAVIAKKAAQKKAGPGFAKGFSKGFPKSFGNAFSKPQGKKQRPAFA
jgi:ATP-dependent RNA helicase RhlE